MMLGPVCLILGPGWDITDCIFTGPPTSDILNPGGGMFIGGIPTSTPGPFWRSFGIPGPPGGTPPAVTPGPLGGIPDTFGGFPRLLGGISAADTPGLN